MALEVVPAGDERCDVCGGDRDRVKPAPGDRWSVRYPVATMCEACQQDLARDLDIGRRLDQREPPPDPSQN